MKRSQTSPRPGSASGPSHLSKAFARRRTPGSFFVIALLCCCQLLSAAEPSKQPVTKDEQARAYFDQAKALHSALVDKPAEQRTAKDYLQVIAAYRKVYLTSPSFPGDTTALLSIGQLSEELARRWNQPRYFQRAIEAYEFLIREYPATQYRFDALLSIARLYRDDLKKPDEAARQYERYLKAYPHSTQAKEAREALAQIQQELRGAGKGAAVDSPSEAANASAATAAVQNLESTAVSASATGTESRAASLDQSPAATDAPGKNAPPKGKLISVSEVRYWETPTTSRVIVALDRKVEYDVGRLDAPARLYIDLHDTRLSPPSRGGRTIPVGGELLKRVRLAQFKPGVSRLVLDLGDQTDYQISELLNPYRLVIDVSSKQVSASRKGSPGESTLATAPVTAPAVAAPAAHDGAAATAGSLNAGPGPNPTPERSAETTENIPDQQPGKSAEKAQEKVVPAARENASLSRSVSDKTNQANAPRATAAKSIAADAAPAAATTPSKIKPAQPLRGGEPSLTRALGLKIGRILLDPGHGGHDTGTIGPSGYTEKELVLDVAQRLGKLIEERLGSEVLYTRESDQYVPLEERVAMANRMDADLFLSIHANSSRSRSADGIETYYLNFTNDPEALAVAARENAGSQETISNLQGILKKIAMQEKLGESKEFASRVHLALRKSLGRGKPARFDRGVKTAPFVVLIGATMPAVLAEVSFLSNPEQEKKLKTPEQRQKIAEALYSGIAAYANTLSGVKVAREENSVPKEAPVAAAQTASIQ